MSFKNKSVLITGSTQGIGKALALLLAKDGANVMLNGRDEKRLSSAIKEFNRQGLRVKGIQADVSDPSNCESLIEETIKQYGKLDILVNNVGVAIGPEMVENIKPEVYAQSISINYLSAIYMTRVCLPYIREHKGSVLFISSIAGLAGFPESSAYCSAKMALTGFAEALRWELHNSGAHIGIAYIGFTENTDGKRILAPGGGTLLKTHKYSIQLVSIEAVANKLSKMLQRRKFKIYYPFSGRVFFYLNRFFPLLYNTLFRLIAYKNIRSKN